MTVTKPDVKSSEQDISPVTEKSGTHAVFLPATDIIETKDTFVILADLPGADEKNVEITLENDLLTLKGHVPAEKVPGCELCDQDYVPGDYERSFTLSEGVSQENIVARMKNGVLRIILQKNRELQPRQIKVDRSP